MSIYVIMPVYNGGKYLKDAIDSILNQTFRDFKLLIINDCSPDNSHEIISSYDDPRIWYVQNEKNLRLAKTLNKAFDLAKDATYIFRMDQDDISHPERLLLQKKYLDQHPDVGVVGAKMKIIDSDNTIDYPIGWEKVNVHLLSYNPLGHPVLAIRNEVLQRYNLRYTEDIYTEDYDLWIRCSQYFKLDNLDDYLLSYRLHEGQMTSQSDKIQNDVRAGREYQLRVFLKLNLEAGDIDVFHRLLEGMLDSTKEDLEQARKVLHLIYSKNRSIKRYNQDLLESYFEPYLYGKLGAYRTGFFKTDTITYGMALDYFLSPLQHYKAFGVKAAFSVCKRGFLKI